MSRSLRGAPGLSEPAPHVLMPAAISAPNCLFVDAISRKPARPCYPCLTAACRPATRKYLSADIRSQDGDSACGDSATSSANT